MPPLKISGSSILIRTVKRALEVLRPPPELTISDWADQNRRLSSEASAEPGQWRTSRAEYLVAIMDWHSRKVLSWPLSNSMEADFCVEALNEAIAKYGKPKIMNSDQGSQFTGFEWTRALKDADVEISMDGKGRWVDNRMIERLWRSLKYECIYLNAFETGSQARAGIGKWLAYYNAERPHSTHGILTPDEAYERRVEPVRLAA